MTEAQNNTEYLRVMMGGRAFALRHGELLDADDQLIPLRAKSARMLEYLVANHGRVIPKDDLAAAVWPGVIATDESIAQCVADIRKALGDSERRIVETFPKRGYRLNLSFPEVRASRSRLPFAMVLVFAVIGVLLYISLDQPSQLGQRGERQVVAVLPFANETGAEYEYLSVGMAEDLIIQLSDVSSFSVIPSTRSFAYAGRADAVASVAQELDAGYILTGHLRDSDGEPKATVELIHGATGTNLWASRFGTDPNEISRFHNEVVGEIARAMDLDLTPKDEKHLARQRVEIPQALDMVIRGRQHANSFTKEDNLAAERLFRDAVEVDPSYARAYAELAAVYAIRLENNWAVLESADLEKAFFFGRKSVELEPDLWLGHYALGRLYSLTTLENIETAERHLRRAMSLQPDNDDARMYFAAVLIFQGKAEESLRISEEVIASNPAPKFWYYLDVGHALFHLGRYEDAAVAFDQCLNQMPDAPYCLRFQIANFAELGQLDDAEWALAEYEALGFETSMDAIVATLPELTPNYAAKTRSALAKAGVH